ncbi:putative transcriptional regulator [Mycobacteroides abscessus subsp. bolletii]|uniref:hypothetical protein n=1 Tax=Mycobacteroides abscessus TaxID=36809 RepID=UPI0009D1822E|nr:hypothetical protein [Mycobacteroides abscessus]SKX80202.1 putative transcriptional regulator [Mycobacteroides abscessus subsp. bolletii]
MSTAATAFRKKVVRFLSANEVAQYLGLKNTASLTKYRLPQEDATIGSYRGWTEESIATWNANRPGPGNWKKPPAKTSRRAPVHYMGISEVAEFLGLKGASSLTKYALPEEDARIGKYRGWTEQTIEVWHASRPGPGNWGART